MARYNYGRRFKKGKRNVMYRYLNKKKSTKTLVDARTKKVVSHKKKTTSSKKKNTRRRK